MPEYYRLDPPRLTWPGRPRSERRSGPGERERGAIALGHPLGATGAILVGTALDELERRGAATALITLCIAGGQGIAAIIERT
jgi:hypothetical protein